MLCLPLVGVFTVAYNGLDGRLMVRVENSSLYSSSIPSNMCTASEILSEHFGKNPKVSSYHALRVQKRRITFNSN